ncbi:hypothetical protein EVAR_5630_1 [Eumeta japonica]|uniref:Uncharacterized protein n=1 Tax=Eumeta variegata TaxID=151549 RepID=A0A4C1T9R8_EUMVA|nr:hypothetical protein EVAR_5630_1 [Eumeta japonica]
MMPKDGRALCTSCRVWERQFNKLAASSAATVAHSRAGLCGKYCEFDNCKIIFVKFFQGFRGCKRGVFTSAGERARTPRSRSEDPGDPFRHFWASSGEPAPGLNAHVTYPYVVFSFQCPKGA